MYNKSPYNLMSNYMIMSVLLFVLFLINAHVPNFSEWAVVIVVLAINSSLLYMSVDIHVIHDMCCVEVGWWSSGFLDVTYN